MNAAEMTAQSVAREQGKLARSAQDIAELADRIARDVDLALSCGYIRDLLQQSQEMALLAEKVNATKATAELFTVDAQIHTTP